MAIVVKIAKRYVDPESGRLHIEMENRVDYEFADAAEAQAWAAGQVEGNATVVDAIVILRALYRDPDLSRPAIHGRRLTLDFAAANPLRDS